MITSAFGKKFHIVFKKDSGVTGNLNISVGKKGQKQVLVHSKKNGDGLVSDSNKDTLI